MSSLRSEVGMDLSIYRSLKTKVVVELKSAKYAPFICQVKGFLYDEDETQVEFTRVDETIFPEDTEAEKQETYVTFVKHVKRVEEAK